MTVNLQTAASVARLALTDRLLILGTADDIYANMPFIDPAHGGAVVLGAQARTAVRRLRHAYPDMLILEQPTVHADHAASKDNPFIINSAASASDQPSLFEVPPKTLEGEIEAQIANGASLGVPPTGFIEAGDVHALRAVVETANRIQRSDVLLHLPLAHVWISGDGLTKVIAGVKRSVHPVAVSLAHKGDPGSQKGVVEGLRRLVAEAPDVSVWFTDLCGVDALAHGALAASIGLTASNRHIVAPGQGAFSPRPSDRSPNILMRDLLSYRKSRQMQESWFASMPSPSCGTSVCCAGRALDSFSGSMEDRNAGHRHNTVQLTEMHKALLSASSRDDWWADRLRDAELAYPRLAIATGIKSIKPTGAVQKWIELNSGYGPAA
jgi:hypothetical protein